MVGLWEECSRFGKCRQAVYELTFPYEKDRAGFRPEVPVSFQHGKYVFDFTSCWSTWVTQTGGEDLNLNITGSPYRCNIAYLPQHVIEHGGEGDYFCRIPFSWGRENLSHSTCCMNCRSWGYRNSVELSAAQVRPSCSWSTSWT